MLRLDRASRCVPCERVTPLPDGLTGSNQTWLWQPVVSRRRRRRQLDPFPTGEPVSSD